MATKKKNVSVPTDVSPAPEPCAGAEQVSENCERSGGSTGEFFCTGFWHSAVILGGIFGIHAIMVDRNADVLLQQAEAAEKKGEFGEAAGHVSRYLRLRPDDIDEMEHLADLLRRSSNSRQGWTEVLASLEQVLRRAPDRHEARRTAIETAFKLRRFSDADMHLAILSERQPDLRREPAVMLTAARTSAGLGDTTEAISRYLEAIDTDSSLVSAYAELCDLIGSKPSDVPLHSDAAKREWTWKDVDPAGDSSRQSELTRRRMLKGSSIA